MNNSAVKGLLYYLVIISVFMGCQEKQDSHKMAAKIDSLEQFSGGNLGVAVLNLSNDLEFRHHADQPFAMASVYKFPIGLGVLHLVSEGKINLEDSVLVGNAHRRWGYSPLTTEIMENGPVFQTYRQLLERMIGFSDNTASDILLNKVQQHLDLTQWLQEHGIEGIRIDRTEQEVHASFFGIQKVQLDTMQYEYFLQKVDEIHQDSLSRNFQAFLKDERDTAEPWAMILLMQKFYRQELLNAENTAFLLDLMEKAKVRNSLIKAAVPDGYRVAHKSGGVFAVDGVHGGENDVALIFPPGQIDPLLLAVFLKESRLDTEGRAEVIKAVTRAAIEFSGSN